MSSSLGEKIDCLESECVAYLSPMGWPGIYSICFPSLMVIRILSHLMGYFLLLSVSDLIRDIERAVYLELSFFLIGGIRLHPQDKLLYRELSYFPCW